jgi:hypothetical protein
MAAEYVFNIPELVDNMNNYILFNDFNMIRILNKTSNYITPNIIQKIDNKILNIPNNIICTFIHYDSVAYNNIDKKKLGSINIMNTQRGWLCSITINNSELVDKYMNNSNYYDKKHSDIILNNTPLKTKILRTDPFNQFAYSAVWQIPKNCPQKSILKNAILIYCKILDSSINEINNVVDSIEYIKIVSKKLIFL